MFPVFYIEETDRSHLYLRRFATGPCILMGGNYSYHNAMTLIGEATGEQVSGDLHPHDDARWPTQCSCGYAFQKEDNWQLFAEKIYKRADTGEEMTLKSAPVGACWNASWMATGKTYPDFYIGEDGRCLTVRTPGGDWTIDARANNYTLPNDRTHKCWVRHGSPEDGTLHVDKNGHTCAAGAGSIVCGSYHGFLRGGALVAC